MRVSASGLVLDTPTEGDEERKPKKVVYASKRTQKQPKKDEAAEAEAEAAKQLQVCACCVLKRGWVGTRGCVCRLESTQEG